MAYRVTKTYGAELGLSACFRQPLAKSHCRFLHGYALGFKFVFEADQLDENNWVMDFGGLKPLKAWLCNTFDHKLLVAESDPWRHHLEALGTDLPSAWPASKNPSAPHMENFMPLADVLVVPAVGCESFARMAWDKAHDLLPALKGRDEQGFRVLPRVRLVEVECRERAGNAASVMGAVR